MKKKKWIWDAIKLTFAINKEQEVQMFSISTIWISWNKLAINFKATWKYKCDEENSYALQFDKLIVYALHSLTLKSHLKFYNCFYLKFFPSHWCCNEKQCFWLEARNENDNRENVIEYKDFVRGMDEAQKILLEFSIYFKSIQAFISILQINAIRT